MSDVRSVVSVTTAASVSALTTLDRAKQELGITGNQYDDVLRSKIREATADITARFHADPRETLTETLWNVRRAERLVLQRRPVASITSITVDDIAWTGSYRLDPKSSILYAFDSSGYPTRWSTAKTMAVVYDAGWIMPGQSGADLDASIESACLELLQSFWLSRGRDPSVKRESIPGLADVEYWVGSIGAAGSLPPSIEEKLQTFRRLPI